MWRSRGCYSFLVFFFFILPPSERVRQCVPQSIMEGHVLSYYSTHLQISSPVTWIFLTSMITYLTFCLGSWSAEFSHSVLSNHCDPRDNNMPGLPVHCQLPDFAQTHVYRVGDAIQPSHPLSSPYPPTFNLSQHQGLLQWVSSSHQVAKVVEHKYVLPISEGLLLSS